MSVRRGSWLAVGAHHACGYRLRGDELDLGWLPVLGFLILPDLAFLAGIGQQHLPRQLPPRAVPLYNLLHHPVVPLVLLAITWLGLLALPWLVGGFAWLAHIGLDRAMGYGVRTRDGWIRG